MALPVHAQRGMGDPTGIARQAVRPPVTQVTGILAEIRIGPCEFTTGHAGIGTHVILKAAEGKTLNIHLGPSAALQSVIDQLHVGQTVVVDAFRTEKLPADHYVAVRVNTEGKVFTLRDESLRPIWAGTGRNGPRGGGWRHPYGRGRGCGYGSRWKFEAPAESQS
jgi:hypothetical protein